MMETRTVQRRCNSHGLPMLREECADIPSYEPQDYYEPIHYYEQTGERDGWYIFAAVCAFLGILFAPMAADAASVTDMLRGKGQATRVQIKAQEISKVVQNGRFTKDGTDVEIVDFQVITGGIQFFVKGWKNGAQLGFGKDGSIEIERIRIFNPPILVDNSGGKILRTWTEFDGKKKERVLTEDLNAAMQEVLSRVVRTVGKSGNIIRGTVGNTTDVFYPSSDGYVACNGGTGSDWPTCHNATTGGFAENLITGVRGTSNVYIFRSFLNFDTSALGDSDTIDTATLNVVGYQKLNDGAGRTYKVYDSTASDTVVADDYDLAGTTAYTDTAILGTAWNTAGTNSWTFNATGEGAVNKTGLTKVSLRDVGHDVADSDPGGDVGDYVYGYGVDEAGTTNDPTLVIEHTAPVQSSSSSAASSAPASSAASSSAPSCTGTGCALMGSGSLIVTHSACNEYILNDSGAAVGCNQWDTSIEIPAVEFFVRSNGYTLNQIIEFMLVRLTAFFVLFLIVRFFFRLFSQRRTW